MHPPFYIPDTRVADDVAHHHDFKRTIKRRGAGTVLRILPMPGWPPVSPYLADFIDEPMPPLPSGRRVHTHPVLHVVPEPRNGLRDALGRFLIRAGQRMILENRPG